MFSPIIAMIHNTKLNRWHPVIFVEKPLPGPSGPDTPIRHKSSGHHTAGFSTREEALAHIKSELRPKVEERAIGAVRECLGKDFAWDGEDIPAMVIYFTEQAGECVPALGG